MTAFICDKNYDLGRSLLICHIRVLCFLSFPSGGLAADFYLAGFSIIFGFFFLTSVAFGRFLRPFFEFYESMVLSSLESESLSSIFSSPEGACSIVAACPMTGKIPLTRGLL